MSLFSIAIISILAISLLYGCGSPSATGNQGSQDEDQVAASKSEKKNSDGMIKGSLAKLMGDGKPLKCTFKYDDEDGLTQDQIIYVSGKKYRMDGQIVENGETFDYHSISDSVWIYIWGDMMEQGTKMKLDEFDEPEQTDSHSEYKMNLDKEYEFKCEKWSVDNSKFRPPADVEFVDISEMMKGMQDAMADIDTEKLDEMQDAHDEVEGMDMGDMCSACDNAPASERAECRAALGC